MKGINKLKVKKTATALLLAGCLFNVTGCNGKVDMDTVSFESLMSDDDIKDSTLIDELIAAGELPAGYDTEENVIAAADKLERYLDIVETTSSLDYKDVDKLEELPAEKLEGLEDISLEDVQTLVEEYKTNKTDLVSIEKKLIAIKKLNYINNYCTQWIVDNGRSVSQRIMKASVKASVADDLEYSIDDYKYISIRERIRSANDEPGDYIIDIKDDKTLKVSPSSNEIWNTIDYIYAVENAKFDEGLQEREIATYRKALNYAKTTLAAGVDIKKNKVKPENSASDIKKNYIKK